MSKISFGLVCLALVLGLACAPSQSAQGTDAEAAAEEQSADPLLAGLGESPYQRHCASCHGVNLEGEANWRQHREDGTLPAPPHDATGHTWHHPDQQLFAITKEGTAAFAPAGYQTNMIGFGDRMSDDEIHAVFDYIKSHWPPEIRESQAEITRQAGE